MKTEEIKIRFKEIHGEKYDYSLVKYINTNTKISIFCAEHGYFDITPKKHLIGQGCKQCGRKIANLKTSLTKELFIEKAIEVHGENYDYSLVNYTNTQTKVKILCHIHGIWEQKPNGHLSGKGCRSCSSSKKLTTTEFIDKSKNIHDNKYNYSLVEYINHYQKVIIICPMHGEFLQGAGSHLAGIGCASCKESKGEREISKWLVEQKINFKKQKTFNNCKFKRQLYFDFYLPDYNLCIEFDGEQHYHPIEHFGGENTLFENKKRDEFKNNFCFKHNISLERIKYDENIIDRLKKIKKIFKFCNIYIL